MAQPRFTLSAFGDEIDDDLETQLQVLASEQIHHLEFRGAWGKPVLELTDDELRDARELLDRYAFNISAIGSPIGKSTLDQSPDFEVARLERAIAIADALGTRLIRIFSFYTEEHATARSEVLARLRLLTTRAGAVGMTLLHENEKAIYGDNATRCHDILTTIDSPTLRMAFDPANFVQVGVAPMREAWPLLGDLTTHVHIKDARFADGTVCPAGEGDGAVGELLAALASRGYQGYLTLEPHLHYSGTSGGYSGEDGMRRAVAALRALLADRSLTAQ